MVNFGSEVNWILWPVATSVYPVQLIQYYRIQAYFFRLVPHSFQTGQQTEPRGIPSQEECRTTTIFGTDAWK